MQTEKIHNSKSADRGLFLHLVGFAAALAGLTLSLSYNYNLFHSMVELFSIAIALGVFLIFWNTRNLTENSYFRIIGVSFLAVGFIDLLHTLSFKGMGVFVGFDANLPTQLWIVSRYILSFTLIGAPLLVDRSLRLGPTLTVYAVVTGTLLFSVFAGWFPDCYVEGIGQTPFKIASEYVICLILLVSVGLHYVRRERFSPLVLRYLLAAVFFSILSELAFTSYVGVFDLTNAIGHFLKIGAFYFIYKAFVVTSLKQPFELLFRDVKEREKALRESEERYRTLAETSFDAIQITVPDGRILYANPAAQRMLGMSEEEICQAGRAGIVDLSDPRLQLFLEERKRTGKASSELRLRRKDGTLFPVFVSSSLFTDSLGELKTSMIFRDISEQKRYEADLQAARAEAERRAAEAESANQAKSRFLSHMSHELRTPINGIMGMTHLADLKSTDPEAREYLRYVRQSAEHLLEVVNDVLDLSKIEAGKAELRRDSFHLPALLESITGPFRLQATQKGLAFRQNLDEGLPKHVLGDPGRLRQVLFNLLGNAIKFTSSGEVELSVRMENHSAGPAHLKFSVRDTGIGIPVDKQERIFESFGQISHSAHASYGGTGLGLAISRHLVELMGGCIRTESKEGRGSTFHFSLPLEIAAAEETALPATEIPAGKPEKSGVRILLAEDEAISRMFMQKLLQHQGHEVEPVANGREALEKLAKEQFDLVLMDVSMPVMGGEEAVRAIRNGNLEGVDPQARVIALTAHAFHGDRARFLEIGFDGYLSKPVNIAKLKELLDSLQAPELS